MNQDKIIILGHINPDLDSIISGILLEYYLNNYTNYQSEFIIPDKEIEKETKEICEKFKINYKTHQKSLEENCKVILVDHNERNNLKNNQIIAIIDHHPTSKKNNCPYYFNEIISSTAALIVQKREKLFPKNLLKLAVLATYVDTASFNSTKALEKDKIWAKKLIDEYNFNEQELNEAGLLLTDLSNLEIAAFTGLKKYTIKNKKVEVSSIQISSRKTAKEDISKIKEIVLNYFLESNLDVYILIIHEMDNFKTTAYKIFKDGIEIDRYDKYTSRGNVIIPKLEQEIKNHTFSSNKLKEKIRTINE